MQTHLISGDKSGLQLIKSHLPLPGTGEGNTFTKRNLCPVSAISELPSAKNNPNANVAYFGVAYSDPLQIHTRKERLKLGKLSAQS